jgi:hypothetical protein
MTRIRDYWFYTIGAGERERGAELKKRVYPADAA